MLSEQAQQQRERRVFKGNLYLQQVRRRKEGGGRKHQSRLFPLFSSPFFTCAEEEEASFFSMWGGGGGGVHVWQCLLPLLLPWLLSRMVEEGGEAPPLPLPPRLFGASFYPGDRLTMPEKKKNNFVRFRENVPEKRIKQEVLTYGVFFVSVENNSMF